MISERKACQKIIKAVDENAKLRRIPKQRREKPSCLARLRREEIQLKKTFPLWLQNVELLLKNSEDVKFLQSMKSDRIATFGSKDAVLVKKIQRKKCAAAVNKNDKKKLINIKISLHYQQPLQAAVMIAVAVKVTVMLWKALHSVQVQNHIDDKK